MMKKTKGISKMENLEKLIKKDQKKFSKKKMRELLCDSVAHSGVIHILVMSMEEISELIDVIARNGKKIDYIHTTEEIVDVKIMIEYMKVIFSLKDDDMKFKGKKKKLGQMDYIINLCSCQKDISKYLRRSNMKKRCEKMVPVLNYITDELIDYYKIKKKDIEKIQAIKLTRLEDRLLHNEIR